MTVRIVLVEDHVAYRESFRCVITQDNTIEVVGEAGGANEGRALIEKTNPDVAVVDFLLPDGNGIALIRELKRRKIRVRTLMLGRMAHPSVIDDAIRAGVHGLVHKQESLEVVKEALLEVSAGNSYVSPLLQRQLREGEGAGSALTKLSRREREVFFLLSEGRSSKEIATALFLAAKTVDAHRLRINRKLGVRSPAGLSRFVAEHGFLV